LGYNQWVGWRFHCTIHNPWLEHNKQFDFQTAIGSLPRELISKGVKVTGRSSYLKADPVKVDEYKKRLSQLPGKYKVGVSWRGGKVKTRTGLRSADLALWGDLHSIEDLCFVNVQYGDVKQELLDYEQQTGRRIHQLALDDVEEMAALMVSVDLVISVCTSAVSLANAVGVPVWVLVPYSSGWMYGGHDIHTDWLPMAMLYRQEKANDWIPVFSRVKTDLVRKLEKHRFQ